MKTLNLSNANVGALNRSLRQSSASVETAKKLKQYESDEEVPACIDELLPPVKKDVADFLSADEEECAPGATKSKQKDKKPLPSKNEGKKDKKKSTPKIEATSVEPSATKGDESVKATTSTVPRELARESDDERECYRHAIVDVPALVELLSLIGRCPVCKSCLRTDKISTDENTSAVTVSLRCARLRCQFTKHWCSSPTAGIFSSDAAPEEPARPK